MTRTDIQAHARKRLAAGDRLIGVFQAVQMPRFWLCLVIGPLAGLLIKSWFVAVTEQAVVFYRRPLLGGIADGQPVPYERISALHIGRAGMTRALRFVFADGSQRRLKAQNKGRAGVATLDPPTLAQLTRIGG
ncbi:hypothetical protein [Salinisphaera sp. T31B1]|uniref:hypothetical protein n=1 Tax=Salinisphaera sp. T31B1 TaxID=727963 RepID=UPI00333FB8AF